MLDKYEPKDIEERLYKGWEEKGYFKADNASKKPPFTIVIPPPNVTGSLHMGHALNNTLQDILSRYKRARGYNVLWLPGCDHAGIATQNVVERELKKEKKTRQDLGREEFVKRVWEWKDKYGKTIMMQLRKLGSSLDWSRERFTMDEGLSKAVKEVFVQLYHEKLIYRGDYIVNWCPRCLTAISDIEVTHKEINGHFYHIRYPYADGSGKYIQVATTRPETMLGDTAVAVNPDDVRYKDIKEGTLVLLPETGRKIPIIRDSYVDKEFGTGAVKITPAHDPNDFEIGMRHKLDIINVMTPEGKMNVQAGENGKYQGLDRFEARKKLVETLKEQGYLVQIDDHKHAVGHCYRCDTVVEPYVSTQWFVKIKPLAQPAIEAVEKGEVRFVPEMWKKVYFEWMKNIKDWCISRQLWWGHRIPAWYCKCGEIIVAKETPKKCPKCGGAELEQDKDVLDTWFSSGLWPFSTLGWPENTEDLKAFYPTTALVTSWDILPFWVARMIMLGIKFMKKPPFADVVINSLVTDAEGKKMSKSRGNVVDPLDSLNKYSADALRFTMASLETQSRYISFSEERLKANANFMNKIWNASKFTITNLEGMQEIKINEKISGLKMPERWILNELNETVRRMTDDMENYRFSDAAQTLYDFFWREYCDWYVEISKIEVNKKDSPYRNTVQNVLAAVLKDSLTLMHVIIPFITEEIYQNLPMAGKKESIMLESWPENRDIYKYDTSVMGSLQNLIYIIRNLRGDLEISPAERVDCVVELSGGDGLLKENDEIIKSLAKVNAFIAEKRPGFISKEIKDSKGAVIGRAGVNTDNLKDPGRVLKNKQDSLKKLENGVAAVRSKLANGDFVKHASEKVLAEEKEKLARYEQDCSDINKIIEELRKIK
jgi:valyl-tRNA synthetase